MGQQSHSPSAGSPKAGALGAGPGSERHVQPPRRAGKSSQARLGPARAGPEVPAGSWGGGAAGAPFLPLPNPGRPRSCVQGSARAAPEQHGAPRSAGGGSAPSQSPARSRPGSFGVGLSGPRFRFAPSPPSSLVFLPGCRAQPRIPPSPRLESVSLAAAAGEAAAARGASRLPLRFSGGSGSPAWLPFGPSLPLWAPRPPPLVASLRSGRGA